VVLLLALMPLLLLLLLLLPGIAIGGDTFPGSTLSDHCIRYQNIPQVGPDKQLRMNFSSYHNHMAALCHAGINFGSDFGSGHLACKLWISSC
jgi:hypothetical protein